MMNRIIILLIAILIFEGCERTFQIGEDDGLPPAVPVNLIVIAAEDGEVLIDWNANIEPDFNLYRVYRSVNKTGFSFYAETQYSYYFDDSLNYNDTYYYMVSAVDFQNSESEKSDSVGAVPLNKYPPSVPGRFYFDASGRNWNNKKSIELLWEPSPETDVDYYKIYRDTVMFSSADSSKLTGTAKNPVFSDSTITELYKRYYYLVRAVDKGGLESSFSSSVSSQIIGIPEQIFPENNSRIDYFGEFIIKAVSVPARYRIIVQTNIYLGEFWSKEINTTITDDTLRISFDPPYLQTNINYYWRAAVYTTDSPEPSSISDLYNFVIKP